MRIRRGSRDELRSHLAEEGIGSDIYYPIPLHLQECFADFGYREGSLPVSEAAARESVSIPVYPEMTADQQGYVIEKIRGWIKSR